MSVQDHEHFGPADAALMATRAGTRATCMSLGGLALTAAIQLVVAMLSGSVALLADTIHNLTDALTAIPLLIQLHWSNSSIRPRTRAGMGCTCTHPTMSVMFWSLRRRPQ